jgi:hypothetical protein
VQGPPGTGAADHPGAAHDRAVAARQPSYVKSGTVTRLQAGGFAAKSDAETFCATVRKGGQACMVVAR